MWSLLRKAMAPKLLRPKDVRENLKSFCRMARDAIQHMVKARETTGLANEIPDLEEILLKFAAESKFCFRICQSHYFERNLKKKKEEYQ